MTFSSICIVILAFTSAVVTPVEGFMNGHRTSQILHNQPHRGTGYSLVKEKKPANVFGIDGSEVGHHHSKRRPLLSSQQSYSASPIESRPGRKTTAVYLLILASLFSFVGDNIMHLPIFQTFYLYHRKWRWWQPITSTFCHGDRSHLSGNVFLLLLFGRSVEDELGPVGLVFSYIFCGMMANFVSLAMLPKNTVSLGASGAVFGLFSVSIFSRISWGDVLDWRKIIEVGVLGQFVVSQFLSEVRTAATGGIVGVNHVAHLSGAGAGVAMVLILRKLIHVMEKSEKSSS